MGGCQSELADNLFEAGQDILRSRDLGFNSLDTAPRHRAVSDRPVTMACCGKDNEEKETGVRHTSTRAPGTIHEPAFEPRRPTILESITTKPGNREEGQGIQDRSRRRHGARPPSIEPRARRGHPRANLASGSGGSVPFRDAREARARPSSRRLTQRPPRVSTTAGSRTGLDFHPIPPRDADQLSHTRLFRLNSSSRSADAPMSSSASSSPRSGAACSSSAAPRCPRVTPTCCPTDSTPMATSAAPSPTSTRRTPATPASPRLISPSARCFTTTIPNSTPPCTSSPRIPCAWRSAPRRPSRPA